VRGVINLKTGTFSEGTGTQISFSNIENFIDATGNSVDYVYASDKANYIVATSATYDGSKNAIDYSLVSGQVEIDLFHETATRTGTMDIDTIINFNQAVGSKFADTITGNVNANNLNGGAGDDKLYGGDGNDYLTGGVGDDKLYGEAGDDTLDGGGGADTISGGFGTDTVTYANVVGPDGVKANLGATASSSATGESGDAAGDIFDGVENLIGSAYADLLIGDSLANTIWGGAGNDILIGGAGDTLYGQGDSDIFKVNLNSMPTLIQGGGVDTAIDTIQLSGLTTNAYSLSSLASHAQSIEILNIKTCLSNVELFTII
jgi:Ca2+-binding RTX toxin-like protein